MYPLRRKALVIGLMVAGLVVMAAAATPQEEMTVRTTYAKAMLAFDIEQMSPGLYDAKDKLAKREHLQIDISTVTVGPIQEILATNVEDLVTKPGGYLLEANLINASIPGSGAKNAGFKSLSVPQWRVTPPLGANWAIPFSEALALEGRSSDFSRYASFDVIVTFMGRQRQYKALFLFGQDSTGQPEVAAMDFVLGMPAISSLVKAPLQQEIQFLQQNFASRTEVKDLLRASQPESGCEADGPSQFCCSSLTGQCGVQGLAPVGNANSSSAISPLMLGTNSSSSVITGGSSAAVCSPPSCSAYDSLGPVRNITAQGTTAHWSGSHLGLATWQGKCHYDGNAFPCQPTCHVSVQVTPGYPQDLGVPAGFPLYHHSLGWNVYMPDGINDCTSYLGFGGRECIFLCTIDVSVGAEGTSVSPKSGVVWDTGNNPNSYHCNTIQ